MDLAIKELRRLHGNRRGQTVLEYLLLLALSFVMGYIIITGPAATFTGDMLATIRNNLKNVVRTGELSDGPEITPGNSQHPGSENRMRPLHL